MKKRTQYNIALLLPVLILCFQNCSRFEAAKIIELASLTNATSIDGAVLYANKCAGCHGALATSAKLGKTAAQISGAIASVGPMNGFSTLTSAEINAIADALKLTAPPATPQFACADTNLRATSLSYPLTKNQYRNVITDLFGAAILNAVQDPLSTLAADEFNKVSNARLSGITQSKMEAYFNIAKAISSIVTGNSSQVASVFGSCANNVTPAASCIDTYINGFAKRIFRRPLNSEEMLYARQIAAGSGTYLERMKTLLTVHLMSPPFLWRLEINGTVNGQRMKLTSYEVASRIAFEATDSTPDTQLMAAADAGQLATKAQVQTHVKRLLQTVNGKAKTRGSLLHWSQQGAVTNIDNLPAMLTQGIQLSGLTQAMMDEAGAYVDYQVYTKSASFKTLLTSKESLASHPGLATIYGHAPASVSAPGIFAGRRQGLLMRAPFLAGRLARTSIIHRGVDFEKFVLCNEIPSPTADIVDIRGADVFSPDEMLVHTNREAIAHQTSAQACMTCHSTINPVGFAFEMFDSLGRIRTSEAIFDDSGQFVRTLPVNPATQIPIPGPSTVPVQDAYDLVTYIANSAEGSACFVKNAHRYIFERREQSEDGCALMGTHSIMSDANRSLLDAMTELIGNNQIFDKQN